MQRSWGSVEIELVGKKATKVAVANIDKDSMWTGSCVHVISADIGRWLIGEGLAPWPKGKRPQFNVHSTGPRRFRVTI